MRFQSLAVSFIFNVPHSQCLVICHADDVFTAGVKQQPSNPVVVTNLEAPVVKNIHVLYQSPCYTILIHTNLYQYTAPDRKV